MALQDDLVRQGIWAYVASELNSAANPGTAGGTGASSTITQTLSNGSVVSTNTGLAYATSGTNVYSINRGGIVTTVTLPTAPTAGSTVTFTRNYNGSAQSRTVKYDANLLMIQDSGWA